MAQIRMANGVTCSVPDDQRVRVTRTIVLEGPAHWIGSTLDKRAWLEKGVRSHEHDGQRAEELARTVEIL